jgi:DNA-binding NarL/FixJ family response regulator
VLLQQHPGWEVCGEASTNSEVLHRLIELKPDVLVKDWIMPGMDSVELTREIFNVLPGLAIVIFSFYDLPELESIAKAAGVHCVASKDLSSLIAAIEKALQSSASRLPASATPTSETTSEPSEDLE